VSRPDGCEAVRKHTRKAELEKVALSEGRSLAQVCEALLACGLEIYKKEGPKYLQRLLSRKKKESSSE